jgi:hypothetical protein
MFGYSQPAFSGYLCTPRSEDTARNTNEYQEYLLVVKGGKFWWVTTLTLLCAVYNVWESQPPSALRDCLGPYMNYFTFTNCMKKIRSWAANSLSFSS